MNSSRSGCFGAEINNNKSSGCAIMGILIGYYYIFLRKLKYFSLIFFPLKYYVFSIKKSNFRQKINQIPNTIPQMADGIIMIKKWVWYNNLA